jgi:hypothetical protein
VSRDQRIVDAAKIVLDQRRYPTDEARVTEARRRAGDDPANQAQAEFFAVCLTFVLEELGAEAVVQIRDQAEGRMHE